MGAMGAMDVKFNIVLSGMPVILFAVGSAYSIHILSRYYANAAAGDRQRALEKTLVETGPTVIAAGMTTVIGLLSFMTMDIAPMRTFGLFTALGIFTTLVLSVTFVPAVIRVVDLPGKEMSTGAFHRATHLLAGFARRNRGLTGALLGGTALVGMVFIGQVDTRMDQSAFFHPGSPPDQAQRFLDAYFGGSQFLQIHVRGDMGDPHVLRELQRLSDKVLGIDTVTQVLVISDPVSAVNDAMEGASRVPDTPEQVGTLFGFLVGNAGARQLVTEDKTEALIHVKIGSNKAEALEAVVGEVERLVATDVLRAYRVEVVSEKPAAEAQERRRQLVLDRVIGLSTFYDMGLERGAVAEAFEQASGRVGADLVGLTSDLAAFFVSEECFVEVNKSQAAALARATVGLGRAPDSEVWAGALGRALLDLDEGLAADDPELQMTVEDLMLSAESILDFLWRRARASVRGEALLAAQEIEWSGDAAEERFRAAVSVAMMNLENPTVMLADESPEAKRLSLEINGLPVLYRGMSESVTANQIKSLVFALVLVWLIMTLLFRSPISGLLATLPTVLTLLVVYGGMGLRGVHLDIGTSMLGSIIIGAGVDYAVHLMAAWRGGSVDEALSHSIEETAPAIWTNAFMVAAGFFVLTLGEARPLQNVGGLTALAMMVAAIMTFLAIPLLARKTHYSPGLVED
jgi:predicted RND superfamily exporter protein